MGIAFRSSVLFVQDVGVSRRFYEGLLGQSVSEDFGECIGYAGGFSIIQRDAFCRIIFGKTIAGAEGAEGQHCFELYFETEDAEGLYARLQQAGVAAVHPVQEQPWGQRVFRVYDPDGHIVEFGEPMRTFALRFYKSGLTAEEVSKRCNMPLDMVRRFIAESGG
jgi:catechol 2,3-dioxygenase-like lactoylglutathione lyase family enzyme